MEVAERGELVAVLAPPHAAQTTRERLLAAGVLVPATSPTGRLRSPRPMPKAAGEPTNQELLEAERDERL